jgi:hypothetical protein
LLTQKEREQIEFLIEEYQEIVETLIDIRNQIWDLLKSEKNDHAYVLEVKSRLNSITQKLESSEPIEL